MRWLLRRVVSRRHMIGERKQPDSLPERRPHAARIAAHLAKVARDEAHDAESVEDDEIAQPCDGNTSAGLTVDPERRSERKLEHGEEGHALRAEIGASKNEEAR